MTTLTETLHAGEHIASLANGTRSQEAVTVLSGEDLAVGHVVGKVTLGAVSETHAGNTGNGAMTLDATTPKLAGAQAGDYTVRCTAAASNGGTFRVFDPVGNVLGDVAVAATFANQIKFAIADGSADFIVGDTFTVTVAAGSGKVKEWNPANLDGSQVVAGVMYDAVDATSADQAGVITARDAEVKAALLTYFTGADSGDETLAAAQLAAIGIVAR